MLKNKNICLRSISKDDSHFLNCLRNEFETNKLYIGYIFPTNTENEEKWIENLYTGKFRDRIDLLIEQNNEKKSTGLIGVNDIDYIAKTANFGIIISEKYQGNKIGSEAIDILFDYLFNQINLRKIHLKVLEKNTRAIYLYRQKGFVEEGCMKKQVYLDGQYENIIIMSLFRSDWAK